MSASPKQLPAAIEGVIRDEMQRLEVPGIAAGVIYDGERYAGGFGVTNVDHPLPVEPSTLFQIGSTSKTFTATALMSLVEAGLVDLDAPVRRYLPDFRLASEEDAAALTVKHLVTHHGGFVGDYFRDTGRGDDALARIVAKMERSPQLTAAGYTFSYSNAGFYALGQVVASVLGAPFEQVIRELIFEPLGMGTSTYFPEDTITRAVASGHIRTSQGPRVARPWQVPRSIAPGGGIISSVEEQLEYAAFHLGLSTPPILQPKTIAFMQTPLADAGSMCDHVGVSWMLDGDGPNRLVKHGGATTGHLSSFEMRPGRGFAVTVLTNSDSGRVARNTVAAACTEHFLGIRTDPPAPLEVQPGVGQYAGQYQTVIARLRVDEQYGALTVTDETPERQLRDQSLRPLPDEPSRIAFIGPDRGLLMDGAHAGEMVEWLRDAAGRIEWMRWDGRIARRVG